MTNSPDTPAATPPRSSPRPASPSPSRSSRCCFAVLYLPVDPWVRAFLGLGTLYLTTSAFTLAKCIRDAQETQSVVTRLDQARVDKILAEHDPFRTVS